MLLCHSGLEPWFGRPFDRLTVLSKVEGLTVLSKVEGLTTLSEVEGESSVFLIVALLDAGSSLPSTRLGAGMTVRHVAQFE